MFCPHLFAGLAAALLWSTQYLKMDRLNELESALEAKTDELMGGGWGRCGGGHGARRTEVGGRVNMPKWAKTPPVVNRIQSALSCCRVHQLGDGCGEGV